ncbi:Uncharacterised protein [Staphylococcus piscifermentans]|nr:Uncharacterised protein [Staphylococcus piscifermentans]
MSNKQIYRPRWRATCPINEYIGQDGEQHARDKPAKFVTSTVCIIFTLYTSYKAQLFQKKTQSCDYISYFQESGK